MNRKLLVVGALAVWMGMTASAQIAVSVDRKWNGIAEHFLQSEQRASRSAGERGEMKNFIVSCSDAAAVAEKIIQKGYKATIITDNVVTADFPVSYVKELADCEEVKYINGSRKFKPTMISSRLATGVDRIHRGEDLETPFTGKGVIVGVIDQGFEYRHLAFLDENQESRVLALWNHYADKKKTTEIPSSGDFIKDCMGHATHVTNIAAGSKVKGNDYYGMAPGADIIMIPSTFYDGDVLEEANYIREIAEKEGKPFVINMSFGSQIGPHDGTGAYCEGMNSVSRTGGILVAAMGNEGDMRLHGYHKFTQPNEKVYIVSKPEYGSSSFCLLDLWGQNADGKQHLKVTPSVYNIKTRRHDEKNPDFWKRCAMLSAEINNDNKKENYYCEVDVNVMQQGDQDNYFALEIEGNPGDEFHAWFNPGCGEFYRVYNGKYIAGDNKYCVGEGAATIPQAVAVASFNGNDGTFISLRDGQKYSFNQGPLQNPKGKVSDFSSRGPFLGAEPKPLVAAPGHVVASAVSKYSDFNSKDIELVASVSDSRFSKYYYRVMSGTSMATPAVTGIIALWLEANPELTYEKVKQIIQETSVPSSSSLDSEAWSKEMGFGKIDAYAGLKKALDLAENTGINDMLNGETPITISRSNGQFRILFNNDETFADITVYNASGVEVKKEQLQHIHRAQEQVINAAELPAGVYVVNVRTTSSMTSKKMLVK